jgi:hypothetical protein
MSLKKKQKSRAPSVQVECQGRAVMEHTTQQAVEQSVFSKVHEKRYKIAGEAPICNGELFQDFGYTGNTPASAAVLDGIYVAPHDSHTTPCESFDKLQPSIVWSNKTWFHYQSLQNNGSSIGKLLMRKHHPLNQASSLAIT